MTWTCRMSKEKQVPQILSRRVVAQSRLMRVEAVDLKFSNGEQRQFERMKGSGRGAVMIVPCIDDDTLLLIREYAAGVHDYQLGFPKGLIDPGETPEEAAQRELKEEVGYGSHQLEFLMELSLAPQFFSAKMSVFVARDLYPESLPGDEPEPLEKVTWPMGDINNLLAQPDFSEARSVAALLMLLRNQGGDR